MTNDVPFTMPVAPAGSYNNGGNGMFGDGGWWGIILLAMLFGWGNNGWGGGFGGNGGMNGSLTRTDLCSEFAFNDLQNAVRGISQGICDSTFALNNTITNGFAGVDNAVCTLGYQTQQGFNATQVAIMQGNNALASQLADCCCTTQRAIDSLRFQNAQDTCAVTTAIQSTTRDVIDNQNANARAILDKLTVQEIAAKDAQIAAQTQQIFGLQLKASQEAQNAYLVNQLRPCPTPAYITCNPWASQAPFGSCGSFNGFNNGGCGCGCGV